MFYKKILALDGINNFQIQGLFLRDHYGFKNLFFLRSIFGFVLLVFKMTSDGGLFYINSIEFADILKVYSSMTYTTL